MQVSFFSMDINLSAPETDEFVIWLSGNCAALFCTIFVLMPVEILNLAQTHKKKIIIIIVINNNNNKK